MLQHNHFNSLRWIYFVNACLLSYFPHLECLCKSITFDANLVTFDLSFELYITCTIGCPSLWCSISYFTCKLTHSFLCKLVAPVLCIIEVPLFHLFVWFLCYECVCFWVIFICFALVLCFSQCAYLIYSSSVAYSSHHTLLYIFSVVFWYLWSISQLF